MRPLAALDLRLLRLLRTRGHTPAVENSLLWLARAGENGLLWYVIALAGAALGGRGRRDAYFRAVKIVLATLVANTVVKQTVRRARPVLEEELPALTPVLQGEAHLPGELAECCHVGAPVEETDEGRLVPAVAGLGWEH